LQGLERRYPKSIPAVLLLLQSLKLIPVPSAMTKLIFRVLTIHGGEEN
jgi:hypothetical protein